MDKFTIIVKITGREGGIEGQEFPIEVEAESEKKAWRQVKRLLRKNPKPYIRAYLKRTFGTASMIVEE